MPTKRSCANLLTLLIHLSYPATREGNLPLHRACHLLLCMKPKHEEHPPQLWKQALFLFLGGVLSALQIFTLLLGEASLSQLPCLGLITFLQSAAV